MGEKKKETVVEIDLTSPIESEEEGTPVRPIFCLKNKVENMKEIEDREDCFILDFDPDDDNSSPNNFSKLSITNGTNTDDSPGISVVAEKGQVALRDFPHSRHSCAKYPFDKTFHETYCELCYCFVCDIAAPCKNWTGHCHAVNDEAWIVQRRVMQRLPKLITK